MKSLLVKHVVQELKKLLKTQWEQGETQCQPEQYYVNELKVSRFTVRAAFGLLSSEKIVALRDRKKIILKEPPINSEAEITKPKTKNEEFEEFFLNRISELDFVPGLSFTELECSKKSGATIGVVREVLQKMSTYGIIEKEPRKHWTVTNFTADKIHCINEVRVLFELHAIELISLNANKYMPGFSRTLREHEKYKNSLTRDVQVFRELDKKFHKQLFEVCNNPLIMDQFLLVTLMIHSGLQELPGVISSVEESLAQHIAVLRAIIDKNWALAKVLHKQHLLHLSSKKSNTNGKNSGEND
jgi:DNA-binding GntR family transcriptional regulator